MAVNELARTTARAGEPASGATGPPARGPAWRAALAMMGGFGTGLVLMRFVSGTGARWLVIPVTVALAALVTWTDIRIRTERSHDDRPFGRRARLPLGLLGGGAVAVATWLLLPRWTNGLGIFGISLVVMGSGWLVAEARRDGIPPAPVGALVIAGGLAAAAGAVAWRTDRGGAHALDALLLPAGVLVVLAGLGLLSGRLLRAVSGTGSGPVRWRGLDRAGRRAVAAGAVLLVVAPFLLADGPALWYAAILVVALFLLVGAIASDTSTDALVLVLAVALVWALMPRSSAQAAPPLRAGRPTIVALGDSFTSGEGARRYYRGTNTPHVNACRRAPSAYPVVATAGGTAARQVVFVACSGATAAEIHHEAQYPGEPGGTRGGLPQIANYEGVVGDHGLPASDIRLIVVSIGGNDAGFGDVVTTCIAPGNCAKAGRHFLRRLPAARVEVDRAFAALNAVRNGVPVLVVPYPIPLSETHCASSMLEPDEHRFLYGFARELDAMVEDAADRAGFYHLDGMENALDDGLRLCDGSGRRIGVHTVSLNPVDGAVELQVNPKNWVHNSFHPNAAGHRAMAAVLTRWLADHPHPPAVAPAARAAGHGVVSLGTIMRDPDYAACDADLKDCGGSIGTWKRHQLQGLARRSLPGTVAALLGACLVWFAVLRARRPARPATARAVPAGAEPPSGW